MTGYLADKSALARMHLEPVATVLEPLIRRGLVHVCSVTEIELLYSARDIDDYRELKTEIRCSYPWSPTGEHLWQRALEIQEELAARGHHRCAGVPDLLIAATAEQHGLTVVHYDSDFDTISQVTGQITEWVVPAGTV
ncbi:hypothetical protein HDA32_004702 [Spinactinospora alkalitolerans]|uniref:Ribonuclease VapC n=1 Tax=Spinactinospora alkalitolerans TaxID=687207 RepID=A0A852U2E6_9ACTN|nr:PIN domain nuclease [Spinactinospora alkalitolerans]NYE49582.1 hypothetical protein [Spinactinospora alkalitolerans]